MLKYSDPLEPLKSKDTVQLPDRVEGAETKYSPISEEVLLKAKNGGVAMISVLLVPPM